MSNLLLQQYRQKAANLGYDTSSYTDEDLLRFLGDDLREKGTTMSQMEKSYGKQFTDQYFGLINAPEPGREGILGGAKEFGAGFKRGAEGLLSSGAALGGMALDIYGFENASDAMMNKAAEFRARAAQGGPSIERATDVRWDNVNDVARFLAGGLGEATPSVIEAAGSFALGGGAGALIAKQAAKKRLNQTLKKLNAPSQIEDILRTATLQAASQEGKKSGANVALAGSSFGMNIGEIYSELYEYSKLDPSDPKYISEGEAKRLSVTYGSLAGGLDFASAGTMLNRVLNIGEEPARRYLKRLVQNLPSGVFVEGSTEAGQEFLAMAAEKYAHGQDDQLTDDEINRMIDAGVLGALGGAQFSAFSAIPGPKTKAKKGSIEPGEGQENRPSVATTDERQKNLDKLLKDPTTNEFLPEVGMDVQAGLGVEGKVKEVRGDGIVTIELADGKDVEVGFETLAPKMRTAEELEKAISKNQGLAEDGDTSSQIEVMKAQGDLLSAVEIAMGQEEPKDVQSQIEQIDSNPESKAVFEKGPNKVSGLTQEQASEMDEVYEGLIKIAKDGKLESYEMNQPQKLASVLGDDFAKKFIKHKNKLEQSGILNSNKILSAANEPAIGLGLNDKGIPNTKRDIDKISQKKQAEVKERTRAIAKRKLGKDVQVKLRNPDLVEKDGTFVEDDRTFEVESIVNPNTGDRGWTDDSNLIKLKGRDELFEPKDLINATPKKRKSTSKKKKKGEPDEPTEVSPVSQQSPKKTVDDLAKSSLTGEDIKVTLEDVRKAFLEKQGGEQGGTVAPQQQELAKQLGFNLDSNGIIEKDNEGNAVTTDVNQKALNDFFAVNSQMLNDPTAQQLALMHREESTSEDTPPSPDIDYLENQIPEQPTEPVTGFHSTDSDDISKFETNPRKVIGDREVQMGAHFGATPQTVKKGRKRIIEVKVDLKNLLRMPDLNQWNWKGMEEWLLENGVFTDKDVNVYKNIKQSGGFREESIQALLKDKGYDGIVYRNEFEGDGNADSFIVFDSSKIKIVTANKKSQISQQIPKPANGEADILNIIQDTVGKIRTRDPDRSAKPTEAMLVIRQALMTGPARLLMGGTKGEPIDTAIMAIQDQVSIDTSGGDAVEVLAEMIGEAVARRYKLAEESKEVTAFNNYVSALTDNATRARNQNATRPISAADLVVGDKFKVKGKWVTVTDFDADGFLLEHEDFGESGRFDIGEQKFPIYLSPERGDVFYADQDLIYAEPFANDESDPFGPTAEEYIDNQSRKYKALRGDGIVDPPLGYVAQKVKFPEGEATYFVPERALINLPTGQMPSTLVGSIQMDVQGNIYDRAINSDGTFNAARFEGLKKTTGDTKNEKGNRVLLIMQKVSDNDDSLPIRSIRVMQAQQGKAGNDVVIKVYDSLKNIGRLVKRESQESKERSSVMEGYMVIGKVTVDNDLSKYFPGDKTRRGRGGKIDAYFENLQRLEDAPFFKMSREEEQNKKNKNYQTLVTTRKIFNYLAGEGRGIQQAYKDRLAELKVPHDSDGKIEVNGKFIYIQKPEDRDGLIASGMDAELAEQVYQANFGNGVTGGLKMQEVHQANLQRDVAIAGNFKFEDKEYSVVQVIMAGQDVNDTSINIGDPIYKKAWSKLGNVGNLSWSGTSEFVDIETGETPLSIGEYSGKYGVDKAFSTSTQLFEIFSHIIDNGGIGSKFLVEDFYTLAEFDVGKYSREDIAVSLGLDKNATDAEIDASLQAFLEESTQSLYKLAAIKGLRREGEEGLSSNLIRPLKTYEYVPKNAPIYEGVEEAPVDDAAKKVVVKNEIKLGKRLNTKQAVEQAQKKMALKVAENLKEGKTTDRNGYSALSAEERIWFEKKEVVHTSLPPQELAELTERIKALFNDVAIQAGKKDRYIEETGRAPTVGHHRNIIRNRLGIKQLTRREDKTIKQEVATIHQAKGSLVERLRDDFEKDIRDAMQTAGFTEQEVDEFLIASEGMLTKSKLKQPKSIDTEIFLTKDKKERVKADGKTSFKSGFSQSPSGKALRNYVDRIFQNLEQFVSEDNMGKWAKFVDHMNLIWIPEGYSFKSFKKPKPQSKPVLTPQEKEDAELSETFKKSQLQQQIDDAKTLIDTLQSSIDDLLEGKDKNKNAKLRAKEIAAYENLIVDTTRDMEKAQKEMDTMVFTDVTEQVAPPKGEWQVEEVTESGLLLTEYAQHLREFFVEGQEYSLPYLESKSYTRGETGVDVLEAVGGAERSGTSQLAKAASEQGVEVQTPDAEDLSDIEVDDLQEALEPERDAEDEITFEFSREDEILSYDDQDMMDKQVPIKKLLDPVTGEVEEGMPIVVDGASAAKANRVARKKLARAIRDGKNPLEALGLQEELSNNRLAIREFLASKYNQSTPFPVVSFVERALEIIAENPGFREQEALSHIARKIKGSKMLQGVKIEIMPWEQYSRIASANENGYSAATYVPKKNKIFVSDVFGDLDGTPMENLVSSIIHEAIHVPTKAFLDVGYAYHTGDPIAKKLLTDSFAGEEMGKLYGQINDVLLPMLREKAGPEHFYALSSIDELLSEVGSDASFRDFLRNQKLTNEDRKALGIEKKGFLKTVWDYIVHVLSMLLGRSSNETPELLQYTDRQLNKVIDLADGLSGMGKRIHEVNVRGINKLDIFASKKAASFASAQKGYTTFDWIDGTTRFHITDKTAKINGKPLKESLTSGFSINGEMMLPDLLDHPELFEAYPQLANVKIVEKDIAGAYGMVELKSKNFNGSSQEFYEWHDKNGGDIALITVSPSAPKDIAVPALIHEIQHIVDDIEGVPAGFNTWFAWDLIKGILGTLMGSSSAVANRDWKYMIHSGGGEKMMNPKVFKQMKSKLDSIVEQTKKLQTEHTLPEHFNYDVFLLYRTMQSVRAMFDKVAEPTSETTLNDWILNTKVGGIDGPTVATFLYFWEFGEVTARTQERFLTEDLKGYPLKTGINNMSELENPPALPFGRGVAEDAKLDRVQSSRKKFADAIEAKKAGEAWSMPSLRSLYGLIQSYSSSSGDLVNVLTTLASLQSSGSLSKYQKAREGFRPDEGARIGHEAQAAGLNELMDGLTIAYREVQDMLPPETTLQDFIDNYGKLALKWKKNKKATKAMEAIQKLLNPFQVDAKNVRITDAGRNRTAKNYGIRAAIAFNERTREHARQEAAKGVESLELFEKELKAGAKVFDDLARRKMHSNDEMVGWIESKLKNNMTVQRLQKLSDYLPNEILNQEDIKILNSISKDEILDVMTKAIEIDGFENMKAEQMNDALRNMSTRWFSGGGTQSSLARVALIIAIKDSKDIMFLFRLARNKLGEEQQGFYDAAIEVAKADTIEKIKEIDYKFPGRVSTKFAELVNARIRQIELKYKIPEVQNKVKVNQRIDEVLQYRTDKYRYSMGELENFDIRNGVKIKHAYQKDGEWKIGEYKVEFKGGELKDRKEFIKINRKTLEFLRQEKDTYGTEPWWDMMREQANMALSLPVTQQWAAVRRSAWMAGLESVNQRFSRMGYEGKRLAGMTARTVALYRDLISKAQFHSREYNRAYENVLSALDIDGQEFYTGMYQDIFWWFDNNPQFAGNESQAFKEMWKYIKKQRNVPNKTRLNETSKNAVRTLVEKTIAARDYEAQVNRDLGNRIKDDDFKVQSYLDGDKMVDFYRMPLDMGYATLPRAINDSKVTSLINYMTDEKRGDYAWSGKIDEIPIDAKIRELLELGEVEEMGKEIQKLFDEEVTVRFLDEFMGSLNRKSLFYGPKDNDGWGNELGNSYVMQKWDTSKGDLVKFMDAVFNDFNKNAEPSKRGQWYLDFYKQLHERFQELKRVDRQIRSKAESETRETEALKHVPRSLDARQIESRLPKGFFLYDMYDETSTSIRMAMFAGASVFGRDGTKATLAFKEGRKKLKDSYDLFASVISEVTGMKPDKPEGSYSKSLKLQAYKVLKKMGHKNAKHKFMQLHNDAVAYGELRTTFQHLRKYYGSNNEAGPYKDARFLLELLGTQSLAVLNNPKSSFMQGMSLFEFPLAFRGANKMALKGTAKALGNFVNQTFGGMAEAMGMQLDKVGRYSANLNNTHFKMAEMELSKRDFITQVGNGAELTDRKNPKRYLRMLSGITQHHKARGTRAPIDMMSLVTGIFPYVNNVVNHSVGVGAIHTYSDLVIKVAEHIEANGLTDKDFREITAEEMGMGGSAFEWIVGEKDGYDNANNMLVEAGAPSITRMAFDFLDRRKVNPDTPVIDYDMGLLINQVAMNNMSGEGFNSKPAWLYTNPMMKYFAFFLGWPLGKVARDNRFIFRGDQDSMNTYAAFLKYIGLMSAIYMPVGLSFAFLIDWYDEEVLNKPNNLPPITPWAALPVIGPAIAISDPNFTLYGLTSRMAKSGTPYGMGFDVMNSLMAKGDPYSAAREFSLDSRIFAFSMFKNIYDAMGNWMHQGEWDWANVGRPLTYAMGGNSVIQMMDATNAMFDFDNEEARVANYIGVRNYIKSTAYLMGMNLKPPTKGYGRPTPVSVNIRQMERAAFVGDEKGFLKEYREAVEAAREYLADQGRTDSPEKYVSDRFRNRSLRTGVTVGKINDADWASILEILPDDARKKVLMYESNHLYFSNEISRDPTADVVDPQNISMEALRARMAAGR